MATSQNPYVSVHGSFSLSTNFHAIDVFVERHKGHIFKSPYLEGFNVGAHAESHMQNTVYVFSTYVPESFNTTLKCLKEESSPSPSVAAVISVLRLARFDTDVFMKFKQVLIERGGYAGSSPATRKDILYDLSGVRNQYYPIKSTYDVCFELARIHMGIKVG